MKDDNFFFFLLFNIHCWFVDINNTKLFEHIFEENKIWNEVYMLRHLVWDSHTLTELSKTPKYKQWLN